MLINLLQITFKPLTEDEGIPLAIMGMFVVFLALVLVCSFIVLLPRLMTVIDHVHPKADAHPVRSQKKKSKAAAKERPGEIPEEIQVVIAAAVAEVIDSPHRIVRTRQLSAEEHSWSLEGRMRHHTSHARTRDGR